MFKLYKNTMIGLLIGLAGGFAYYYFVGCQSGSCPISSNPIIITLYGGLLGVLAVGVPKSK